MGLLLSSNMVHWNKRLENHYGFKDKVSLWLVVHMELESYCRFLPKEGATVEIIDIAPGNHLSEILAKKKFWKHLLPASSKTWTCRLPDQQCTPPDWRVSETVPTKSFNTPWRSEWLHHFIFPNCFLITLPMALQSSIYHPLGIAWASHKLKAIPLQKVEFLRLLMHWQSVFLEKYG